MILRVLKRAYGWISEAYNEMLYVVRAGEINWERGFRELDQIGGVAQLEEPPSNVTGGDRFILDDKPHSHIREGSDTEGLRKSIDPLDRLY